MSNISYVNEPLSQVIQIDHTGRWKGSRGSGHSEASNHSPHLSCCKPGWGGHCSPDHHPSSSVALLEKIRRYEAYIPGEGISSLRHGEAQRILHVYLYHLRKK
uniref:Uncharacterized protein n=1 Tax=Oryza nivara TaxID=4536 RepID=A0A0E0G105_ORYNI